MGAHGFGEHDERERYGGEPPAPPERAEPGGPEGVHLEQREPPVPALRERAGIERAGGAGQQVPGGDDDGEPGGGEGAEQGGGGREGTGERGPAPQPHLPGLHAQGHEHGPAQPPHLPHGRRCGLPGPAQGEVRPEQGHEERPHDQQPEEHPRPPYGPRPVVRLRDHARPLARTHPRIFLDEPDAPQAIRPKCGVPGQGAAPRVGRSPEER
ncbi:hypothetical protein GA0115252_156613, partial [Streptomyces sp. DfronAA-171]